MNKGYLFAILPQFEPLEHRGTAFADAVNSCQLPEFFDDDDNATAQHADRGEVLEAFRLTVLAALLVYVSHETRDDCTHMVIGGIPYVVGGGVVPEGGDTAELGNGSYGAFSAIASCPEVVSLMLQWAQQDAGVAGNAGQRRPARFLAFLRETFHEKT